MTKAEAFVYNSPRWKFMSRTELVYKGAACVRLSYEGPDGHWLDCYSYFGDSILHYPNGRYENIEYNYDYALKDLI